MYDSTYKKYFYSADLRIVTLDDMSDSAVRANQLKRFQSLSSKHPAHYEIRTRSNPDTYEIVDHSKELYGDGDDGELNTRRVFLYLDSGCF
jgi:hypothetical protein